MLNGASKYKRTGIDRLHNGFTLIELLIVLAIIATATSGAFILYSKVTENYRVLSTIELLKRYTQITNDDVLKNNWTQDPFRTGAGGLLSCKDRMCLKQAYAPGFQRVPPTGFNNWRLNKGHGYGFTFDRLPEGFCEKLVTRVFNLYDVILINQVHVKNIAAIPNLCIARKEELTNRVGLFTRVD